MRTLHLIFEFGSSIKVFHYCTIEMKIINRCSKVPLIMALDTAFISFLVSTPTCYNSFVYMDANNGIKGAIRLKMPYDNLKILIQYGPS